MSDLLLYAIELENKKVFLQVSPPIYQSYLFQECQIMFDFVKKNRPIAVIHTLELEDVLKVNYWVKYFMRHYGIDNVRGGNYTDEVLSEDILRFLRVEIDTTFSNYEKEIDIFEDVLKTYLNKDLDDNEKTSLIVQNTNYKNRQNLLSLIKIPENIIEDLEWIKEEIVNVRNIYNNSTDTTTNGGFSILSKLYSRIHIINTLEKDRYKIVVNKLKNMINVYHLIDREQCYKYCSDSYLRNRLESFERDKIDMSVLIKNPCFTLDNFFFHPYVIMDWESQTGIVNNLLDNWVSMAHSILNWRDEIIFDISSLPLNFEKKTKYSLDLYDANNANI